MQAPIKEPLNPAIHVRAFWIGYTQEIHVVFPEPHEYVNKYEVYRDDNLIYELDSTDYTAVNRPTLYDHDKHTNLFWKTSNHEFIYRDVDVQSFTKYSYIVKAYQITEGETIYEYTSRKIEVITI